MGELSYEIVRVGAICRFLDGFIRRLRLGQPQVLPNRSVEKIGLLRHESDLCPQVIESEGPKIVSLQQYSAAGGIPEPKQ